MSCRSPARRSPARTPVTRSHPTCSSKIADSTARSADRPLRAQPSHHAKARRARAPGVPPGKRVARDGRASTALLACWQALPSKERANRASAAGGPPRARRQPRVSFDPDRARSRERDGERLRTRRKRGPPPRGSATAQRAPYLRTGASSRARWHPVRPSPRPSGRRICGPELPRELAGTPVRFAAAQRAPHPDELPRDLAGTRSGRGHGPAGAHPGPSFLESSAVGVLARSPAPRDRLGPSQAASSAAAAAGSSSRNQRSTSSPVSLSATAI